MSTWPSGAIARATVNGEPNVLAMRANDGHWYSQHGLNWRDEQVTDARPLVVLDPAERPNVWRVGKKRAGRLLDGIQHDGYPRGAS